MYFHDWIDIEIEIVLFTILLLQVFLEVWIAELVSFLILPIFREVLLNSIVC